MVKPVTTEELQGQDARIYKNLHNGLWSIRIKTLVQGHSDNVTLTSARFEVQPGGRKRVLATGRKAVHAFVRGTVQAVGLDATHQRGLRHPEGAVQVGYSPLKADYFYRKDSGERVSEADVVHLTPSGVYAVNPR